VRRGGDHRSLRAQPGSVQSAAPDRVLRSDLDLDALLAAANGRRRTQLLARADVDEAVAEALASPHGVAVRHGGRKLLAMTTMCLAVKAPRGVVVGIRAIVADRPSPGVAWKNLQPWQQDVAKNVDKARAWANQKASDRVLVAARASKAATSPSVARGDALYAAVLADPSDDASRRVLADYLVEIGDPRGELIHVQCELAAAKTPARKRALGKRERELLRKHGSAWRKSALQDAKECTIRRGFVASVRMSGTAWASKGARLYTRDPIEELIVSEPNAAGLAAIAAAPHTARLRALLAGAFWLKSPRDIAVLHAFLASPHVGAVPAVELFVERSPDHGTFDTSALLDGVVVPAGVELSLGPALRRSRRAR
jgi:uncharacterized protein (TIGR02996 family)